MKMAGLVQQETPTFSRESKLRQAQKWETKLEQETLFPPWRGMRLSQAFLSTQKAK
jgi:hypothetical protein